MLWWLLDKKIFNVVSIFSIQLGYIKLKEYVVHLQV